MQYSQEHLKTMVYAKFGGQTECIMGNSKIENTANSLLSPGVRIVECGAKWESGKDMQEERERERGLGFSLTHYPTHLLFFLLTSLVPSPPSERLEQVILQITLGLWY